MLNDRFDDANKRDCDNKEEGLEEAKRRGREKEEFEKAADLLPWYRGRENEVTADTRDDNDDDRANI